MNAFILRFINKIEYLIKAKCMFLCLWVAQRLPLQNKVVFCNYFGNSFGGDPKYIALAMLQQKMKTKLYWMTNNKSIELPKGIIPVPYGSFIARWHLHTAKVWIYNYKNAFKVWKREGQYYVQTCHGAFPYKKVEKDAEELLTEKYLRETKMDSKLIDLMYSNNEYLRNVYRKSFWYDGEVIKSSSPHLSVLINTPQELKSKISSLYGIPKDSKILLYEPTFRKSPQIDIFRFDIEPVLEALNRRFGGNFIILIRLHPNCAYLSKELNIANVINVTDYPDNDELMAISDVLITDFSSVAFDFTLKQAPVFIFAKDYDLYLEKERGLYIEIADFPFSVAKDEDSLCRNIKDFDYFEYINNVNLYYKKIGLEEKGNGADYIVSLLKQRCGIQ